MVVPVIEIPTIVLLVMVGHAKPLMARMIRHGAIVRKWWGRRSGWDEGDGVIGDVLWYALSPHHHRRSE